MKTHKKRCIEEKDEWQGIGGKILEKDRLKKAKLWVQNIGAGNITQGSEVRQTISLIMEIRKRSFNSLGVIYTGKGTRSLNVGLFFISNCLGYKTIKSSCLAYIKSFYYTSDSL